MDRANSLKISYLSLVSCHISYG
uniref:Uncharacterized protein n=1 Tax=Arundo donax TaxID=35708 RepID=A0A0A8YC57_ARUDO